MNGSVSREMPWAFMPRMKPTWLARIEICRQRGSTVENTPRTQVSDPKMVTDETK